MATSTRAHPQRTDTAGESSSAATLGEPAPNIVTPAEPGHVSDINNPSQDKDTESSSESENDTTDATPSQRTLDEQIANAIRTRDELTKKQQLQSLTEEIHALERGEKRTAANTWENAGTAKM